MSGGFAMIQRTDGGETPRFDSLTTHNEAEYEYAQRMEASKSDGSWLRSK